MNVWLIPGAAALRSVNVGVVCSAKRPNRSIAGPSCSQEGRELREVARERAALVGASPARRCRLRTMKFGDLLLDPRRTGASARSESSARFDERLVLRGEDAEHLVEFAQRRVRAADDRVQVAPAPGQAGAEFVDDDREALALGQAVDVAEQIDVDRARGVRDRQQVLPFAFVAAGDLVQRRRQRRAFGARLGGQAVDELLADQRLGFDRAARVGAEVLEARVFDVQHDRRLRGRRRRDRPDDAHLHALDLHVLAGDDVGGVVEDRAHGVAAAGAAAAGDASSTTATSAAMPRAPTTATGPLLHPLL